MWWYHRAFAHTDQAGNAQYPALHLRHVRSGGVRSGFKERREAAVPVGVRKPGRDTVGVVLVARALLAREVAAPPGRIDFGDDRAPGRDLPAVEGPEMNALPKPLANKTQLGNPGMGGFGDQSLYVEMKSNVAGYQSYRVTVDQGPLLAHPEIVPRRVLRPPSESELWQAVQPRANERLWSRGRRAFSRVQTHVRVAFDLDQATCP